jgi:hypothetical protein
MLIIIFSTHTKVYDTFLQTRREDVAFTGESNNYDMMLQWMHDKCVPLVREITFENAEVC